MLKDIAISVLVYFYALFCGCGKDNRDSHFAKPDPAYKIRKIGKLPADIPESSGLITAKDETLWTINDGGNSNELFRITYDGNLVEKVKIEGTRNVDWEDLARDNNGHIYIGDFGNNANNRKDLTIYKVREKDMQLQGQIRFSYPDQTEFPPAKENLNFDCEAMIWQNGHLYLFSKDRSKAKLTKLYRLPDSPGTYVAEFFDSLKINTWVTGADLSKSANIIALSGYGKVYLFGADSTKNTFSRSRHCIPFRKSSQAEALVFISDKSFIISNEQGKLFLGLPRK